MPDCTDGKNDMFYPRAWNESDYRENCKKSFNVDPDMDSAIRQYGGKNLEAYSNIIFSNGNLDPWYGGGVLETTNELLKVIFIEEAAHHLDLRASHKDDPPSVVAAREQEVQIIDDWITSFAEANK